VPLEQAPPLQVRPHTAQFVLLDCKFASQPFDGFPSQSANGATHC
jgi:hypothetical protein